MIPSFIKPLVAPMRPYYFARAKRASEFIEFLFGRSKPERIVSDLYPRFVEKTDVVIEIGTRYGTSTKMLSDLCRFVYSFEAERRNFNLTRAAVRRRRNVRVYHAAVGDHAGSVELHLDKVGSVGHSIEKVVRVTYEKTETVRMVDLDSIRFEPRPTTLVLDCEGAEIEVLRGARRLIPSLRAILVEPHELRSGQTTTQGVIETISMDCDLRVRVEQPRFRTESLDEKWVVAN